MPARNSELNRIVQEFDRLVSDAMEQGDEVGDFQPAIDLLVSFRKFVRNLPDSFKFEQGKPLSHFNYPGDDRGYSVKRLIFSRQDLLTYVENELRQMRNWRRATPSAFRRGPR